MKTVNLIIFAIFLFSSCGKTPQEKEILPANYPEMFKALNLKSGVEYSYIERINNMETGNRGKIRFSLADTSMTETYNAYIIKDYFKLDSFKAYSCQFKSLGKDKYSSNNSVFINNARKSISFVNGSMMVSFDSIYNGSYYYYQYLIKE